MKGFAVCVSPTKLGVLSKQTSQGLCNFTEMGYKFSHVLSHTKQTQLGNSMEWKKGVHTVSIGVTNKGEEPL